MKREREKFLVFCEFFSFLQICWFLVDLGFVFRLISAVACVRMAVSASQIGLRVIFFRRLASASPSIVMKFSFCQFCEHTQKFQLMSQTRNVRGPKRTGKHNNKNRTLIKSRDKRRRTWVNFDQKLWALLFQVESFFRKLLVFCRVFISSLSFAVSICQFQPWEFPGSWI